MSAEFVAPVWENASFLGNAGSAEFGGQFGADACFDDCSGWTVFGGSDLAFTVNPGHQIAAVVRDHEVNLNRRVRQRVLDGRA